MRGLYIQRSPGRHDIVNRVVNKPVGDALLLAWTQRNRSPWLISHMLAGVATNLDIATLRKPCATDPLLCLTHATRKRKHDTLVQQAVQNLPMNVVRKSWCAGALLRRCGIGMHHSLLYDMQFMRKYMNASLPHRDNIDRY